MAAVLALGPDVDWRASGGLFEWTLEFLIARLSDQDAANWLREVVDNNLGSASITDFPPAVQEEIVAHLRKDLLATAARELPETDRKDEALAHLQELVDLTYQTFDGTPGIEVAG